ncbi:MAG: hypothetical protein HY647_08260 [Acidobacteria bacterium]|nr:hypothetical protein [Acidobacteriota bacterium]
MAAFAQECLDCHGMANLDEQRPELTIPVQDFEQSVHALLGCSGCHSDVGEFPHGPVAPPQCNVCHDGETAEFNASVHGQALARGDRDVPSCQGCHGSAHATKPVQDTTSPVFHLNLPRTCGTCHGDPELARRHGIPIINAYQLYMDSIHGRAVAQSGLLVAANCSSCHGSHGILPKNNPASKVYRTTVPTTCGVCHAGILPVYSESVHGMSLAAGDTKAPVCTDCHTAHEIARVEAESWKLDIIRECGSCHEESLRTYRDTFHGQVTALGFTRVARCSDCHGAHDILPASDEKSLVSATNRVATCQKCHPRATESFARFSPHADPKNREKNPGLYYSAQFMNLLLMGVFLFFGVHTGLWLVRSLMEPNRAKTPPSEESDEEQPTGSTEGKGWDA